MQAGTLQNKQTKNTPLSRTLHTSGVALQIKNPSTANLKNNEEYIYTMNTKH